MFKPTEPPRHPAPSFLTHNFHLVAHDSSCHNGHIPARGGVREGEDRPTFTLRFLLEGCAPNFSLNSTGQNLVIWQLSEKCSVYFRQTRAERKIRVYFCKGGRGSEGRGTKTVTCDVDFLACFKERFEANTTCC